MIQCQVKLILRPAQERQLQRWLFRLTGVWNWAVRKIERDARDGIYYSRYDFKALLTGHSRKVDVPAHALVGAADTAWDAWKRAFAGLARRPRLKGRRNRLNSILFTHGPHWVRDGVAMLPGLQRVRFHKQVIPEGRIGYARIVRRASGWYLCLFVQADAKPIPAVTHGAVGIDSGFSRLLTLSSGEVVDHPRELEDGAKRLAQAQRGNCRRLIARLQERQSQRRRDRNHKISRRLVAENALIAWSKDNTRGIARSFGKSVSSSSHYQLRRMLSYKSRAGGREFVEVASRNSTRRCSACGALTGPTGWHGLSVRRWECACGATHDRDVNAARNTLIAALGSSVESGREAASGIAT